jgi:hypothetical protein
MVDAMRARVFVIVGLLLAAPLSHAAAPSPAAAVDLLLHANHGINEMSGKEVMDTWEAVRRDPAPYLPHLKQRLSVENIEAAGDTLELREIRNATSLLFLLGGGEERGFLHARLKELQVKRDELSKQVRAKAPAPGAALSPSEDASFTALVKHWGRYSQLEQDILRGFAKAGDPSLRDTVLPRLEDDSDMRDAYLEYFEATSRGDPLVRDRLKKLLEAPVSPLTRHNLKHFFEEQ